MSKLNPRQLFDTIARDVPQALHPHLYVTGSLAAAYHFEAKLEGRAVNTKDADVVVHPAGDTDSSRNLALQLLQNGWVRTEKCHAQPNPEPADELLAIRLYPPGSKEYFLELLNVPEAPQPEPKRWLPLKLDDGWYGLPSFRYMSLTARDKLKSEAGIEYATPAMMALANLLAHPIVGTERMESDGPMKGKLRSAKDLGRVLAIAWLAGRDETESWLPKWRDGLIACFPHDWQELALRAGTGLYELINTPDAFEEAWTTTEIGLLNHKEVTVGMLHATAERLFVDLLDPLAEMSGQVVGNEIVDCDSGRAWIELRIRNNIKRYSRGAKQSPDKVTRESIDVYWIDDALTADDKGKKPLLLAHGRELRGHLSRLLVEVPAETMRLQANPATPVLQGWGSEFRLYDRS